jgi:uncharacterized protein YukE
VSQVHVDPERVRAFAHLLKGFGELTGTSIAGLRSRLQRLGSTWRDQEYERFVQEFRKAEAQVAALRAEIDKLAPALEEDARAAEEIHRMRLG